MMRNIILNLRMNPKIIKKGKMNKMNSNIKKIKAFVIKLNHKSNLNQKDNYTPIKISLFQMNIQS